MSDKIQKKKNSALTLANKITLFRILMIPVIVIALVERAFWWYLVLFSFSALTDLLDGLAARLRGERTQIGAFLDPMADKLLLTSVYLTLTYINVIDVWVFVVVFSRDLLIVLGWAVIYILTRSYSIQPRLLGKLTTAVQMLAALLFTMPSLEGPYHKIILSVIVGLTVASIADYIFVGEKKLGQWA